MRGRSDFSIRGTRMLYISNLSMYRRMGDWMIEGQVYVQSGWAHLSESQCLDKKRRGAKLIKFCFFVFTLLTSNIVHGVD